MTASEIAQLVQQLEKIEVHGKENLNLLLGAIQFLEKKYFECQEEVTGNG